MAEDDSNNDSNKNVTDTTLAVATAPPAVATYAKQFPDVSRIEVCDGHNFRRWNERIFTLLDVHGVASALTDVKPDETKSDAKQIEKWNNANKVCRHTILSILSDVLFDVYCSYKVAKEILDNMNVKYTTEDATKQKFVVGNYLRWQMKEDKEIKVQINEYLMVLSIFPRLCRLS